ncbi:MAG: hypothetical protein ACOCV8_01525 [Spirochaetota bacterium]
MDRKRKRRKRRKEKGFTRVEELKRKINDKKYMKDAISKMASDICDVFYK